MLKKITRALLRLLLNGNTDILNQYLGQYVLSTPKFYGSKENISIAGTSNVNNGLFNAASGTIVIKDYVFFGHNVSIIAATHDIKQFGGKRMEAIPTEGYDIFIEEGVWVGSNSIIIGPCKIGKNSVIAAGSVVVQNVGEYEIVGGVPARLIKKINQGN